MAEKAVRERWHSTDEQRQRALLRMLDMLEDEDPRVVVTAARTFVMMDAQTLAWCEHEFKKRQSEGDQRTLVEIARGMGAKLRAGSPRMDHGGPDPLPG